MSLVLDQLRFLQQNLVKEHGLFSPDPEKTSLGNEFLELERNEAIINKAILETVKILESNVPFLESHLEYQAREPEAKETIPFKPLSLKFFEAVNN